ncbi:MAG: cobalt ECF transporter T component CbiQ [Candidatus Omnitrophica bacterium CG12_big_fil_rev_8_21_14_0_65_43_15]|uniref:Cobalt ECF transporter T component CbiQ n=1 Tax=Candidatus Taenaricola geysiri TaxID=1974752 RepID=A0A2J0LK36_9BACT|nr:MAG: cobalt ECF transporter T component CbiQ [Candidatus Omnitrophica bacterium CG1_02_43_210]PIV12377.1 MAG: cobalt ECF transporter T component CbiQ [Candidatus Omnitrophica bacterium CG03_land_8_20_14_0_80_43_22]PIW65963.1 MAG: cobalt ECF transporter T component CbiQ [Candidatus Omnitrophica bacterium CG12_big_fil_rev_8_21_14_0_65_43_15]PIW79840.1 MAG: cobalt ECF transporter T component CbiQ [Candidatus Omnitrophica bacterium CG_4_8_14_3_um_filter_43_15]PIY84602.1 MAG: cobalt ECF transport
MKNNRFVERSITGALSFFKDAIFADEEALKKGFLQARDARLKMLMVFVLILAALFSKSIVFIAGIYAFCVILALASSINIIFFLKRTWFFIPLFSLCIALPALFDIFSPGEKFLSFKVFFVPLSITKQGLSSAGIFFARVLTSVSLCVLLSVTTRHYVLLKALRVFRAPQVFVMTLGMCCRYVYLFIEIIQNTYMAIKSRAGGVFGIKNSQGVVAWNIAALWQRSYVMHNRVYEAMLSRGYSGEPKVIEEFDFTYKDWFWLGTAILILGLSLWQNHYLN